MNNNRNNNNNRRRGRGNRQQGGGGANQNRIDSRARGNAPQLLDKYKKLAQDAAHNGDRVQAEYYLQFADHYFRVIADNKARQDEQRGGPRPNDRDYQADDYGDEDDFDALRQPQPRQNDRPNDRGSDRRGDRGNYRGDDRQNDRSNDRGNDRTGDRQYDRPGDRAAERPNDRQRQHSNRRDDDYGQQDEIAQDTGGDEASEYEPVENPFTRGSRERGRKRDSEAAPEQPAERDAEPPRRGRGRPRKQPVETQSPVGNEGEIDIAALPPSFSASEPVSDEEGEAPAKRKLPPRRRRAAADETDEGGESLKAVG